MKISMLCFSSTGQMTGNNLKEGLERKGHQVQLFSKSRYLPDSIEKSHTEWTEEQFGKADALIYIGACGIAVRSIAPFLVSKKTDPAVLVTDECGNYVISLLSGHLGGANELTKEAAEVLGGIPVITTATDLHGAFAVDVFAKKNDCAIYPMTAAKEVSATLLAKEKVGFYSEIPWEGTLPEGLVLCNIEGGTDRPRTGIAVSIRSDVDPFEVTVHVVPHSVSLGMGCRKGKGEREILEAAENCLKECGISRLALETLASIDLKKEERGLLSLAESWQIPFLTFPEEELKEVTGTFTASEFVRSITGVENVCERSAVLASGHGTLIQKKISAEGVTAALAVRDRRICFE